MQIREKDLIIHIYQVILPSVSNYLIFLQLYFKLNSYPHPSILAWPASSQHVIDDRKCNDTTQFFLLESVETLIERNACGLTPCQQLAHWCQKLCRHWIREACTLTVRLVVLHCPLFHDCVSYLNASFLFSLLTYMAHYWPLDRIRLAVHANHAYSHLKLYEVNLKIPFLFEWSYS